MTFDDTQFPTAAEAANAPPPQAAPSKDDLMIIPSLRRRLFAWLIDYALALAVMIVLIVIGTSFLVHGLIGYGGAIAADAGVTAVKLAFHGGHGLGRELGTAAGDEWVGLVLPFILILLAAPLFQFVYQAGLLAWRGRTIGKMACDIGVQSTRTESLPTVGHAMGRAAITTASETGLFVVACILVVVGHLYTAVGVWLAAVILFWVNALTGLRGRRRTLADRAAATAVIRTSTYAKAVQQSSAAARTAVEIASTVGGVTRQTVSQVVHSDLVQRASSTRTGQQVAATAVAATEQVKALSAATGDHARSVRDQLRSTWREQRAQRRRPPGDESSSDIASPK